MPTRIIRDGILTSERVNALTPNAELFYRRLMSVADDYGRFSANMTLLRASCYPLKLDSVKEDSIKKHLAECVDAGLIFLYTVEGKAFLEMQDFGQRINGKSKFPGPGDACPVVTRESPGIPDNFRLDVSVFGVVSEVVGSAEPQRDSPKPVMTLPLVDKTEHPVTQPEIDGWAQAYPGVDVVQQLHQMRQWCIANVANRKTKRGISAFVIRWLAKAQDKSGQQRFNPLSDIARTTVPPRSGEDPALARLKADDHNAAPMPQAARQFLAKLKPTGATQ